MLRAEESKARQLLARASILAEAKSAVIGGRISQGKRKDGDGRPQGNAHDTFSFLLAQFENCSTLEDFKEFCETAEAEIDSVCKRKAVVVRIETAAARDARMLVEGKGFEPGLVAVKFQCGPRDVMKARLEAGLDPATGERERPQISSVEVRRALVRQRASMGMSVRDIEKSLGVPKSIVHRDLAA